MEILIYNYEGAVLKFLNKCFKNIKVATYASDEDLLLAISDIKYFPALYYSREESDWTDNKILSIVDNGRVTKFCQFEQTYKGTIIVEDQKEAQKLASALRFYWDKNSKCEVNWPSSEDTLEVQMRLLYIKIKEFRKPNDKKGACRGVEFSWKSKLFQNPIEESTVSLVEKVRIHLTEDSVILVKDNDGNDVIGNNIIKEI